MTIRLYKGDLPADYVAGDALAIDTETLGLVPGRDRLCLVQVSRGDGHADLVQIMPAQTSAPVLQGILSSGAITKLFHYARFDVAVLLETFGVLAEPLYCTKIASKLARTYTDRHGLRDLVRDLLGVDLSKQQQSSDWGAPVLTDAQLAYAASDVLHLHGLRSKLDAMLEREGRADYARAAFAFLPTRARLDLAGWKEADIFAHT